VLAYLFPAEATALEALAERQLASPVWPGESQTDVIAGAAAGRAAAALVVAHAQADKFFTPWSGTVPTGPGLWFSSANPPAPPAGALFGQATPYFLTSGDQFRPAAPPAFGSPAFDAALAEVRQISDTRTAEQDASAKFWAFPAGTYGPPGYWNEVAAKLAVQYHLGERAAAHLFALMNMVGFDAIIASHDAKFTYWLIRPSQADPGIQVAIGLPNFPSYPSNHSAISAGMTAVLGAMFPAEKAGLDALAEEAGRSRILGGIHYSFDNTAGLQLGRTIAAWALAHDRKGHESVVLR
jgi:membrane-associated phospholipid phosphatase